MSGAVQDALILQLRRLPASAKPNMREIRLAIAADLGACSPAELAGAIQSLRYQGKLSWDALALAPSMIVEEDASGSAMPEVEGGAAAAREVAEAAPLSGPEEAGGPDDDDDYPGEVNDAVPVAGTATPNDAGAGFVPPASLHKAGRHAAATRAGAKPCPAPAHEPEIARLVREEANEKGARRARARSTGTVRVPLEVSKYEIPGLTVSEAIGTMLTDSPHAVLLAVQRKHPVLWKRAVLLSRLRAQSPMVTLYAALERGLEQLEPEVEACNGA